jgi:IS605 OrfB family transposase
MTIDKRVLSGLLERRSLRPLRDGADNLMNHPLELNDFKQQVADLYSRRSHNYDEGDFHPRLAHRLIESAQITPGQQVLDIATGTGLVAIEAAQLVGSEGRVVGVDISTGLLEQAKRKAKAADVSNIELMLADAEALNFPNNTFDRVLCCSALPLMTETDKVLGIDLGRTDIRTNQQPRPHTERRRSNSWAFFQLRQFLTYKAVKFGVKLVFVDPRYTSQTCHKCLHIHPVRGESYRSGKKFRCGHCGWVGDADENGAKNISALGRLLDQPGGSGLACSLLRAGSRATEIPVFRVATRGSLNLINSTSPLSRSLNSGQENSQDG